MSSLLVVDIGTHQVRAGVCHLDSPQPSHSLIPKTIDSYVSVIENPQLMYFGGDDNTERRPGIHDHHPLLVPLYSLEQFEPNSKKYYNESTFADILFQRLFDKDFISECQSYESSVAFTYPLCKERDWSIAMAKVLFETYNVPNVLCCNQSKAAISSMMKPSFLRDQIVLSVYVGHSFVEVCPVINGYTPKEAIRTSPYAGKYVDEYWTRLLYDDGHVFETFKEKRVVRNMKEKLGFITPHFKQETTRLSNEEIERAYKNDSEYEEFWTLNDSTEISINKSINFVAPETLFSPYIYDRTGRAMGVSSMIYESVSACGLDNAKAMLENIYVSGGSSKFPGFLERLQSTVQKKFQVKNRDFETDLKVVIKPYMEENEKGETNEVDRSLVVWKGLYNYASSPLTQQLETITRESYEMEGERAFH